MNLFQLNHEQNELLQLIENGDISSEDAADTMDAMDYDFDKKIENICHVLRTLKAKETALDNEVKRLTDMKASVSANILSLNNYALCGMIAADKKEIKSDLFKVSIRNGREVVKVTAEGVIPNAYCVTKPSTSSPDKKAILAALKDGMEIAGCELTRSAKTINIK